MKTYLDRCAQPPSLRQLSDQLNRSGFERRNLPPDESRAEGKLSAQRWVISNGWARTGSVLAAGERLPCHVERHRQRALGASQVWGPGTTNPEVIMRGTSKARCG